MELHNTCYCQRARHWSIGDQIWTCTVSSGQTRLYNAFPLNHVMQCIWFPILIRNVPGLLDAEVLLLIWTLKHLLTNTLANTFSLCCWDLQDCKHKTWPPIGQLFCTQWLRGATGLKTISHVLGSLTLSFAYRWGGQEIAKPSNLLNQKGLWVLKMCHGLGHAWCELVPLYC